MLKLLFTVSSTAWRWSYVEDNRLCRIHISICISGVQYQEANLCLGPTLSCLRGETRGSAPYERAHGIYKTGR